jgi:protein-tyrosine phosphatase
MIRVLMVCLGNICRSPTAEAVLRHKLRLTGLDQQVEIDSAGTGSWHIGQPPDARSQRHAARRGYDLSALRARQVTKADFERFDYILAMDGNNMLELEQLQPERSRAELRLFAEVEVPDPYSGDPASFEHVLDLVESAGDAWVEILCRRLGTS